MNILFLGGRGRQAFISRVLAAITDLNLTSIDG